MAFLFIAGGLIVTICHYHHCEALCDVDNLQVYCHYVKNPISKDSIPFIVPTLLLIANIHFPFFEERGIIYTIIPDFFQRYYLTFLSTFAYRAPPSR